MMLLLLQREEKERVTTKNLKQNLPCVLKIEHTFPQVHSSTIYNFTMQCSLVVNKIWTLQAYLASSSYTGIIDSINFVSWCWQSNSWISLRVTCGPYPTDKPPTRLFRSYFYSCFYPHTSYNLTSCAIYSTQEDSAFTTARIGSYTLFLLPPHQKTMSSSALVITYIWKFTVSTC